MQCDILRVFLLNWKMKRHQNGSMRAPKNTRQDCDGFGDVLVEEEHGSCFSPACCLSLLVYRDSLSRIRCGRGI